MRPLSPRERTSPQAEQDKQELTCSIQQHPGIPGPVRGNAEEEEGFPTSHQHPQAASSPLSLGMPSQTPHLKEQKDGDYTLTRRLRQTSQEMELTRPGQAASRDRRDTKRLAEGLVITN
ncbi:Hypothetical predicted protein [Pelobates cultripes]|uniref:Uncharacterized protein n=1 Tax=Pelobates cultripes TaxID=61616 RepID=A0AAD1VT97_PELCU|nr:Hypothetical predicted protein [Pelobates cultripes]